MGDVMSEPADEIIALIPAYNEVNHIRDVVERASKYLPVVVIDDGSSDGSGAAAALAGAKVLAHTVNRGKGVALNTGFDYGVARDVAAAITLDADGQHDPDEIPLFIEAFRAGQGDIIIGRRTFGQMPRVRQTANRIGNWLLGFAMGQPVPDNQSGYRLLSRDVLRTIRPTSARFEAEVEILLRAQLAGYQIGWVPIKTIYADEVSHYRPRRDVPLFLKMVWRIWLARRRGRFQ
jgi:glycosyltransferase involved in cell wall biosynthesis